MGELVSVSVASELDSEWVRMKRAVHLANTVSTTNEQAEAFKTMLARAVGQTVDRCRVERKRVRDAETPRDTSDAAIVRAARFTDALPLDDYSGILHLVPRLVNVVTLAEAIPVPGSGLKLPLDLHAIGSRCSNSYCKHQPCVCAALAVSDRARAAWQTHRAGTPRASESQCV